MKSANITQGHPEIADLAYYADKSAKPQTEDVEMTVKYVDGSGKSRVKGGKDLKQSQAYPRRCLAFEIKRIKGSYCWFWFSFDNFANPFIDLQSLFKVALRVS